MNILVYKTVLFIDLDGTLIKTASGNTFPKDCTDFIIRKEVLDKIAEKLPNLFFDWHYYQSRRNTAIYL